MLECCTPESAGISSVHIRNFLSGVQNYGFHGFVLSVDGKIAAEAYNFPYQAEDKRHVYSISKSWTSTAIGFAVEEGLLSVDAQVISFFPECLPETVSENLSSMKVKHLLMMGTGHEADTTDALFRNSELLEKTFLAIEVKYAPGTHFVYNSGASYMLASILTRATGCDLLDFLKPRLFAPLGIEGVSWMKAPTGIRCGGWGIRVSLTDMLKLGLLYLNKGVYDGKRVISEKWVNDATSQHIDNYPNNEKIAGNDWGQGYGYQFWRCQNNCFRGDGAFGQYIVVMPDKNAVFVLTSMTGDMQNIMNLMWENIYANLTGSPLLEDEMALSKLKEFSSGMTIKIPESNGDLTEVGFKVKSFVKEFECEIEAGVSPDGKTVTLCSDGNSPFNVTLTIGDGKWTILRGEPCEDDSQPLNPATAFSSFASEGTVYVITVDKNSPHSCVHKITKAQITVVESNL